METLTSRLINAEPCVKMVVRNFLPDVRLISEGCWFLSHPFLFLPLFLRSVPVCNEEEDAGFTGKRLNSKMVVFSGSKTSYLPKMMTLYEQCIRVLQNNIDCEQHSFGFTKDVPVGGARVPPTGSAPQHSQEVIKCKHGGHSLAHLHIDHPFVFSHCRGGWSSVWDPGAGVGAMHTRTTVPHWAEQPGKQRSARNNVIKYFCMQVLAKISRKTPTNSNTISNFECLLLNMIYRIKNRNTNFKYRKTWHLFVPSLSLSAVRKIMLRKSGQLTLSIMIVIIVHTQKYFL